MANKKIRVGIVGLTPGRSWAATAHLPGLALLRDHYEVAGVANSSADSAKAAAQACGIPRHFDDAAAMAASPHIDLVVVTVKVPHHLSLVTTALRAGKAVYCEWPLGNGLEEARQLARLQGLQGLPAVIGTQARLSPVIQHMAHLVHSGEIGELLSSTIVGTGLAWGASTAPYNAYLYDKANGATMLSIPVGHTLAAVRDVLGDIASVSAMLSTRRRQIDVVADPPSPGPPERLAATSPDDIVIAAELASGVPLAIRYCGGTPPGTGLLWEIHGTRGSLQLTGPGGHTQLVPLALKCARGPAAVLEPEAIPDKWCEGLPNDPVSGNLARLYQRLAKRLNGQDVALLPTFDDAVALHRIIDAVETSARDGRRCAIAPVMV
ncbi:MAG: Gfo/Idh/MocA family oxidoreductase [Parahaliea sp.]